MEKTIRTIRKGHLVVALLLLTAFITTSCEGERKNEKGVEESKDEMLNEKSEPIPVNGDNGRIKVLNLATFHMGPTPDANSTEFDEHSGKNRKEANDLAKDLSNFRPTVIIVETRPEYNQRLKEDYDHYRTDPDMKFDSPSEIELIAFEVRRMAGTERIVGIDHKMEYGYGLIDSMANTMGNTTYSEYMGNVGNLLGKDFEKTSLVARLKTLNMKGMLDFFIEVNADILAHIATEGNFEGADEAAKLYHRNLRMYSNLNQIPLTEDDRVFILMGASHTAFFRHFFSRSPKYEMVDTFEYLGR